MIEVVDGQRQLKALKRIVVKIGSSLLTANGQGLDLEAISHWARQIADLHKAGHEIILVSSGAVAEGMVRMKLEHRPTDLPSLQACAARAWYELSVRGKNVPRILKEYVERWSTWLVSFAERFGGHSPNDFPIAPEQPVWIENDFTAHMCGLWLAGACYSRLAGSKVEGLDYFIDCCAGELAEGFTIVADPTKAINGAWSPDPRVSGDNGMSFGFYTGECFRGLSLYIIYKNHGIGYDFYQDLAVPDHFKASINV